MVITIKTLPLDITILRWLRRDQKTKSVRIKIKNNTANIEKNGVYLI